MAVEDIPVFREARRGQVVRSGDWNSMQQELRSSIRTHRHTGQPADEDDVDTAAQITSEELADDAVTAAKIADAAVGMDHLDEDVQDALKSGGEIDDGTVTEPKLADGAVSMPKLSTDVQTHLGASVQARTDVVSLGAGDTMQIDHGFGAVPISVVLGILSKDIAGDFGLRGAFEFYGGGITVFAAVPAVPDGTFTLISRIQGDVDVRWWVYARTGDFA